MRSISTATGMFAAMTTLNSTAAVWFLWRYFILPSDFMSYFVGDTMQSASDAQVYARIFATIAWFYFALVTVWETAFDLYIKHNGFEEYFFTPAMAAFVVPLGVTFFLGHLKKKPQRFNTASEKVRNVPLPKAPGPGKYL